ncbi:MAG: efflux RND transporter periplasmic adaptor subunit [Phycisphaerales bacterium]
MKKNRVLALVLGSLALIGIAAIAYVERGVLYDAYCMARARVSAILHGDSGSQGEKGLYYCPMHPSFTSDRPGSCAICGMSLVKKDTPVMPEADQTSESGQRKILYYRNPMNPQVTSPVPMKDEMGMDYVPVYEDQTTQTHPGAYISPEKQQLIGVKTGQVAMRRLSGEIRTVGRVAYDPNLFTAQEEYLQTLRGRAIAQKADLSAVNKQSDQLVQASRYRLLLMGMSEAEIKAMEERGSAETNLFLPTPDDKNVWVYVTVYEYEAGLVREGMPVHVDTLAYPGQTFEGRVVSLTPLLEAATRTLKARALVENPEGKLKLEMFANVRMDFDLGERLAVPEDAVMHAGTRDIVYLAEPNGYFEPRTVKLGTKAQGYYEVLEGLTGGEQVVTSANFLVDSESKLNAVLNQMGGPNQPSSGHQHGSTP